jgi:alpha-D-xyloside xylohydrolase
VLEFAEDPTAAVLDRQYMLGGDVLVAPVMSPDGQVTFYLPAGTWTHLVTGERLTGPGWVTEKHDFDSVPVLARPGSVIAFGAVCDRPDYDWADGVELRLYAPTEGQRTRVRVPDVADGPGAEFDVAFRGGAATAELVAGRSPGFSAVTVGPGAAG